MMRTFLFSLGVLSTLFLWQGRFLSAGEIPGVDSSLVFSKDSIRAIIVATASRQGVDPALVQAIISVESSFDPLAISDKGAMGLMQLMPETASRYGVSNPFDPRENVAGGIRYLRDLLFRFENLLHALAAYNAGETAILRYQGLPPYQETRDYVEKVIERYRPGQLLLSSASVLSLGRRASDVARVLKRAREFFRLSWVNRKGRSSESQSGSFRETTKPPATENHRPLIEVTRGPLVHLKKAPRTSVQLRGFDRQN